MAISAASDAAEAVLRMNQNISKPSTLAEKIAPSSGGDVIAVTVP